MTAILRIRTSAAVLLLLAASTACAAQGGMGARPGAGEGAGPAEAV